MSAKITDSELESIADECFKLIAKRCEREGMVDMNVVCDAAMCVFLAATDTAIELAGLSPAQVRENGQTTAHIITEAFEELARNIDEE